MTPEQGTPQTTDQIELAALKARLAALEVELIRARQLSVDEIRTKTGPFSFFDRHGIMGLLFAVFVQTAGIIWWASSLTNKVGDLKYTVERQQATQDMMARTIQDNADRLTRVQTVQENVVKLLDQHTFRDKDYDQYHGTYPGGEPRGPPSGTQKQ